MLGKSRKSRGSNTKVETIIGQQTRINGDIHFSGGLHIDGKIKGSVIADEGTAVLTVSEHGHIEGNVQVPVVVLNGSVTGDVTSTERVELAAKTKVAGNVYYNLIEMAMGAEVNGNLVHRPEESAAVVNFDRDNTAQNNGLE